MYRQSGYAERPAVYELISVSPAICEFVIQKQGAEAILRAGTGVREYAF